MKDFDPALVDSTPELAYQFVVAYERVEKLRDQSLKIEHELAEADETLGTLDRWMMATFEANPTKQAIRLSYHGKEMSLSPTLDGVMSVAELSYPSSLKMVPLPVEPDFDGGVPKPHPISCVAMRRLIDEILNANDLHDDHVVS
jgi:hypothetical protein